MLFAFRGLMVGLGFFGVMYCLLSLLVICVWRCARPLCRNSAVVAARVYFGLRIFPFVGSAFITLAFALPAFFLLEGGMDEDMGTLLFSVGTILLIAAGVLRVVTAQTRASQLVSGWLKEGQELRAIAGGTTVKVKAGLPPLLLYGISTPRVLLSEDAISLLTADELRVAVRHEIGHLRSRDNLKKLILHAAPFPGMRGLERAWQEAAEFAADEAAVSNSGDAVDLAAALIKLCALVPVQNPPAFTTGLVDLTALVNVRVQRLLDWNEDSLRFAKLRWWFFLPAVVVSLPYAIAHYDQTLLLTHKLTEWFIH